MAVSDGKTTLFEYDAAGRLVKEGDTVYSYSYLDKVASVSRNGKVQSSFSYHMSGQLARADRDGRSETFLWDGLALIRRGDTAYLNEPHASGGNPVLDSSGKILFNDMLGSTLATSDGKSLSPVEMTAFGQTENTDAFFTGKPHVDNLGYAFFFRNYRPTLGKWQTADPLGYPDGWNNFAYCNNRATSCVDILGTDIYHLVDKEGAFLSAGHSAWIIGNAQSGYAIYDYGSVSSGSGGGSLVMGGFTSVNEASIYLNMRRNALGESPFDKMQSWSTSAQEDVAANLAAAEYASKPYHLTKHNCYLIGPNAIFVAINALRPSESAIDTSENYHPNDAFGENLLKGATLIYE